jgi:hypothetical protein
MEKIIQLGTLEFVFSINILGILNQGGGDGQDICMAGKSQK